MHGEEHSEELSEPAHLHRPDAEGTGDPSPSWLRYWWLLAVVPVVVTTARVLADGWLPVGDNAFFSIRARDVLTEHHPLLGAWSSGSISVGINVNNLGPLQLDLLALPVKVDWVAGTAIGVAATNVAAIVIACVMAARVAGAVGALVVASGAAGLCLTLGELVVEPRQHHALVLPAFCFLVLVWALWSDELRALPWTVLVASLLLQTHFTYATLVPVLLVVALVGVVLALRRGTARDPVRPLVVASAVAVVCWVQPLLDQVAGRGNMSSVLRAAQVDQETAGLALGLRSLATVVTTPPFWFPTSFEDFDPEVQQVGTGWAVFGLLAVLALFIGLGLLCHRSGDRVGRAAMVVAGAALTAGLFAGSSQTSSGPFGFVSGNFRWLWALAAFAWVAVAVVGLRSLQRWRPTDPAIARAPAIALVAVVLLAVFLPSSTADEVLIDADYMPVARELMEEIAVAEVPEPVAVARTDIFLGEPYTYVLMAALQDRGVDWRVVEEVDVLRYGEGRAADDDTIGVVRLTNGDDAWRPPAHEERLAYATAFTEAEQDELMRLRVAETHSEDEVRRLVQLEGRWKAETIAVVYRPHGDAPSGDDPP
jgi:hypothetical protein